MTRKVWSDKAASTPWGDVPGPVEPKRRKRKPPTPYSPGTEAQGVRSPDTTPKGFQPKQDR
jgi:hypothetical protein